ncbi:MAG: F0F1 ATP synthase subunit delta [Sulfurovum sp.]
MIDELISKRYANALSSFKKELPNSLVLLNTLSEVLADKDISSVISSPMVSNKHKTEMILSALDESADNTLINFIKILGENRRLDLIPVITKLLNREQQVISNEYEGILQSNSTIDEVSVANLEETLKRYTGATIKLTQESTELDGLKVVIDDLGIEVNFSKQRVKEQLIDFITKSL